MPPRSDEGAENGRRPQHTAVLPIRAFHSDIKKTRSGVLSLRSNQRKLARDSTVTLTLLAAGADVS